MARREYRKFIPTLKVEGSRREPRKNGLRKYGNRKRREPKLGRAKCQRQRSVSAKSGGGKSLDTFGEEGTEGAEGGRVMEWPETGMRRGTQKPENLLK